jgi:hypothetical protein
MHLDLEGRIIIKGRPSLVSSAQSGHTDSTTLCVGGGSSPPRGVSSITTWESTLARLRQRIQEVQDLIREDLYDLEEPLIALGCEVLLSPEQTAQLIAAKAFYDQVFPECCHTIERILLPFGASHEQEISESTRAITSEL